MKATNDMKKFRKHINELVDEHQYLKKNYDVFDNFPLNKRQCFYIVNWSKGGMVYEKNLERLTGYRLSELNVEDMLALIHPEDRETVRKITQGVVNYVTTNPVANEDAYLFLSFRFLKKNGTYCKLLRQSSAFERDNEGRMISNFSILTDISFLETANRVEWDFQANNLDIEAFKKLVYGVYKKLYSKREKEIIRLIADDMTSEQIAAKLNLSKHTIVTHRRNILKKSKSQSIADVLLFCKKNGIIT